MSTVDQTTFQERKKQLREQAHANRNSQPNKEELSRTILDRFVALPEYRAAKVVMYYVDVRSEVRTRHFLPEALKHDKKIIVPYCVDGELELFHITSMDELAVGMYKILEPKSELRSLPEKRFEPEQLDLVMVPGVAFDRTGARMGHGFGYYDKLLQHARPDAPLIALAFECQLFPQIPTQAHDIFMDKIITEQAVYEGRGRSYERRD
jgi:5-formyltetrahydrofolate cyclo-ligase